MSGAPDCSALKPLSYHETIVDYLRQHEAEVWQWASERTTYAEQLDSLRAQLLRDTYRIDAVAHKEVHDLLSLAMTRLGIDAPTTLYQSPGQQMNASLIHVPGEVHVILQGPLLERLDEEELLAVFGHELSHYLLWSREGAKFLVADRILNDALASMSATASHRETYRRYALHTELFADRGGAIAAGAVAPAVSALVKIQTGMAKVDAAAYLRQAQEIETNEEGASEAHSHPETFIRARALALWWEATPDLDDWINSRLHGRLSLERLDLPGQMHMHALTRGFLSHYLAGTSLQSDLVSAQLRMMFPDWRTDEPSVEMSCFGPLVADDGIRNYLNALMIDLALADPDQQDAALLRAGQVAQTLDSFDTLQLNLRRDVGFGKREMERYKRQFAKEARA